MNRKIHSWYDELPEPERLLSGDGVEQAFISEGLTVDFGPIVLTLIDGGSVIRVENDLGSSAFAPANREHPVGTEGWYGPHERWCEFISPAKFYEVVARLCVQSWRL